MSGIYPQEVLSNMAALALSVDTQIDNLLEGIDEVRIRLGLTREQTLIALLGYRSSLHSWMQDHFKTINETEKPMNTFKELQRRAFQQSTDKGFHDNEPEVGTPYWIEHDAMKIALIHSELSEALEELRSGRRPTETYYTKTSDGDVEEPLTALDIVDGLPAGGKPEGVPSELADAVIRIMDYAESRGIDLQTSIVEKLDYNATRGHMHGGKKF